MLKIFAFLMIFMILSYSTCLPNDQAEKIDQINSKIESIKTKIVANPEVVIDDLEKITEDTYRIIVDKLPLHKTHLRIEEKLKTLKDFKLREIGHSQIHPAPAIKVSYKTPTHHLFKKTKTYKYIISGLFISACFLMVVVVALILFGKEKSRGYGTR